MPDAAPKPCPVAGCPALTSGGPCAAHLAARRVVSDSRRGSAASRGYGAKWRAARVVYLRAHPLCVVHRASGAVVPATVVDHVRPHGGDLSLFWNRDNWQALCKACHDRKTAIEDGGFGRG